jgi:hypothetical protein
VRVSAQSISFGTGSILYKLYSMNKRRYGREFGLLTRAVQTNLGEAISPFNARLIMGGAVTLSLRMRRHNENALAPAAPGKPSLRRLYPFIRG